MKKICAAFLLFPLVLPLSAQDDVLESDYTLGRITGGNVVSNAAVLGPLNSEWTTLIDQLYFQVGRDDRLQFGFSFLGGGIFLPGLIVGISDINAAFRQGSGSRVRFEIGTNLFSGIFTKYGFDELDPGVYLYMLCLLQWDFLSRKGGIAVDPDYYDMAFFCGPQVNRGQFGFRSGYQFFSHEYAGSGSGGLYFLPVLGITDHLQASGRVNLLPLDEESENSMFGIRLDYRLSHLQLSSGWLYKQKERWLWDGMNDRQEINSCNEIFLEGTCVSGHRVEGMGQVRGNWDGYFSDLLGPLQVLSRTKFSSSFTPNDTFFNFYQSYLINSSDWWDEWVPSILNGHPLWAASQALRLGLLPVLTLGSDYTLLSKDGMQPRHRLFANATLSNVKPREQGPSEVSKFEYTYGYLLKEKEFKVSARCRLPLNEPVFLYVAPVSLSAVTSAEAVGNSFWPHSFFFGPAGYGAHAGSFEQWLDGYDFVLSASVGAGMANGKGRIIVSNYFGFVGLDFSDITGNYPTQTTVISDNISFTIPAVDRSAMSFGFQCSGQTDRRAQGLDKFYCLLYFNYSLAF